MSMGMWKKAHGPKGPGGNLFDILLHTRSFSTEGSWIHGEGLRPPRPRWKFVWNKLDTHGLFIVRGFIHLCSGSGIQQTGGNVFKWLHIQKFDLRVFMEPSAKLFFTGFITSWLLVYGHGHTEICSGPVGPMRKKHPNSSTHSECNLCVWPWTLGKGFRGPRAQSEKQTYVWGGGKTLKT